MRCLDIERALLEHYEPYSEAADAGVPRLELPEHVWRHVAPVRVQIEPLAGVETVELAYRLSDGLGPLHTVGARFRSQGPCSVSARPANVGTGPRKHARSSRHTPGG
jgi:hypothetical protein